MSVIKTTSYEQLEILENITNLYLNGESFDLDPTYSKGKFYESGRVAQPRIKSDLIPRFDDVNEWDASELKLHSNSIGSICFDPPFIVGHTKDKPTGIIGERFHGFRYIKDLWEWYDKCLSEFYRVLDKNGVLVFKCQDTVSSGKQYLSHVHIINEAEKLGFYCRDMFILNAKNRIIGHNHHNQKHARKFHSYFLVFEKRKVNL